jgi:hypothetical protein
MNDEPDDKSIEKYLRFAREFLSPEKVKEFEEAYLRMKTRSQRWQRPPPLPDAKDSEGK